MAISVHGAAAPLAANAQRSALPRAGQRLCLLMHGLGCDGCQWRWEAGDQAIAAAMPSPASTRLLIWLGSPSLGSPLERLGKLGHLRLVNDRRVYLQITEWVVGDCAYWDSRS